MPGSFVSARFQADDNFGRPLVGGQLFTYANGTTTPVATYQNSAGTILNTNPIILDGRGEAIVFLTENQVYTFVLRDSLGAIIYTSNEISSSSSGGSDVSGALPTYVTPPTSDLGPIYWVGHGPAEWNGTQYVSNYSTAFGGNYDYRNVIGNGEFIQWPEADTFDITSGTSGRMVAEFWRLYAGGSAQIRATRGVNSADFEWGRLGRAYGEFRSLAAVSPAAADINMLSNIVEGYEIAALGFGSASAGMATLSFNVRASQAGLYSGSITNANNTRSYVFTFVVNGNNTLESKTIVIPIDKLDPSNWGKYSTVGIRLNFDLGSGTNYETASPFTWQSGRYHRTSGSIRVTQTNNAAIQFTQVQFERGQEKTPFEVLPIPDLLLRSGRYFHPAQGAGISFASSGTVAQRMFIATRYEMRAQPTTTITSSSGTATGPAVVAQSIRGVSIGYTSTAAGQEINVQVNFDARLT